MSSSLNIPGSNVKITDGTIVMLARFPGTRWVVHNGWYVYNGRNYFGWYFCSVPAQTVLPVNPQDLVGISVVSSGDSSSAINPSPNPGYPCPGPEPGVYPGPYPGDNFGPNPFPPVPPCPPHDKPAYFGQKELAMLNASMITVPNIRDLYNIDTRRIPNGRIVAVNSVDGERKFFIWNMVDDRWDEFEFVEGYSELESKVSSMNESISTIEDKLSNIEKLSELFGSNTIIVSNDSWIADSGVEIGDDTIEESVETASDKTVATEKAVVKLIDSKITDVETVVEEVTPKWVEF